MKIQKAQIVLILMGLALAVQPAWAKRKKNVHPDYTKGDQVDAKKTRSWNVGPTGVEGYFWSKNGTKQVLVNKVQKNSPAAGILRETDVILGLNGGTFKSDARRELVEAITEAEKKENGGKLVLTIWRPKTKLEKIVYKGKRAKWAKRTNQPTHRHVMVRPASGKKMQVTITLPVLGTYSKIVPWECPKTKAMIDKAGAHLLKKGLGGGITSVMNALGLLATGEKKYLPMVREYAHKVGGPDSKAGGGPWHGSYRLLFLTEYYLATKDETVLPYINKQAEYFGKGVSGVGTYSHCMANWKENGLYGPPGAYGAMNQCSETCILSMVMAKKCGVKNKLVDEAVKRGLNFLRYYVDKGTIPYGDHAPNDHDHDNNGRNSQAAVLFDIAGDKEAATYFTRMTVASYPERESGHTGHFWSWIWGPLGAARGGKEAAGVFCRNTRYYTDFERRFNGESRYPDNDKNHNWETTGLRLLQHCLPRKQLYITGKGESSVEPITGEELKETVAAATFDPRELSIKQLLKALGNWSLIVREKAAVELGNRDQNVVRELITMLDSPNRFVRYGACIGLQYAGRGSADAVKALINKVQNGKTGTMKYFAVVGLGQLRGGGKNGLGKEVKMAIPALLKLAATLDKEQDPYGKLTAQLAKRFFYGGRVADIRGYFPNGKGLEKQDPDLVVGAMKVWLTNPNGGARSTASGAYDDLSEAQLNKLWGEIYYAAKNPAPSGVMFAGAGQANSTILLAKNRFKEALPLAAEYVDKEGWGKFGRVPKGFEALSYYGSAVKPYMEMLKEEHKKYQKRKPREVANENKKWEMLMKNLDKDFDLKTIERYVKEEDLKK